MPGTFEIIQKKPFSYITSKSEFYDNQEYISRMLVEQKD